jgi:hypothetical protein
VRFFIFFFGEGGGEFWLTGSQALHIFEVAGRACGDDLAVGQLGELDGQTSSSGAAAVDQERDLLGRGFGGKREAQGLIETLTDTRDRETTAVGSGV